MNKSTIATILGTTLLGLIKTNSGSKSFVNPKKVQSSIDVDFIFSITGEGFVNPTGIEPIYFSKIIDELMFVGESLDSIVRYSKKWQNQMTNVDLSVGSINNFFGNNLPEYYYDALFVEVFLAIGNDCGLDAIKDYSFVLKNLLENNKFNIEDLDLDINMVTYRVSIKIKVMDAKSIDAFLEYI